MRAGCRACKCFLSESGVWPPEPLSTGGRGCKASDLLLRRDHHDHLPAFKARTRLDHDVLAQVGLDPRGHLAAELLVAHFAATEADVDLDLVALFQEAAHVAQLDLVVALVSHRTELEFLDLDLLGLLFRLVGLLLLLEAELAEVHDLADRRIGVGLDLHEIQPLVLGHAQRFVAREHADHLAFAADHAHARDADFLILPIGLFGGTDVAISGVDRAGRRGAAGVRSGCRRYCTPSLRKREANSATVIVPRSSPPRVRTAIWPFSFSRSPTTSR